MKIKLDENLPVDLAEPLSKLGHDVDTVFDEGLSGQDDDEVWKAAQKDGRFLISQDLYFADVREHSPGSHHGVLLVRLVNPSREALVQRIVTVFKTEDVKGRTGCNVVVTNQKARVRSTAIERS